MIVKWRALPMDVTLCLSRMSLLCHIRELAYRQKNTGYPISRLPDIAQKTTCTQKEAMDVTFQIRVGG